MDTNVEDKIMHQIEKNLSNNINENLFTSGRILGEKKPFDRSALFGDSELSGDTITIPQEQAKEAYDYAAQFPQLSRAEYIRQAREACLRQMNSSQGTGRGIEEYIGSSDPLQTSLPFKKKSRLFQDGAEEENSEKEIASFRSLIIRTVCAVVLFLSIFIIDKFEIKWGDFSYNTVREFVTGNDQLLELETWIVSWLK